jgi:hypothetical protein
MHQIGIGDSTLLIILEQVDGGVLPWREIVRIVPHLLQAVRLNPDIIIREDVWSGKQSRGIWNEHT